MRPVLAETKFFQNVWRYLMFQVFRQTPQITLAEWSQSTCKPAIRGRRRRCCGLRCTWQPQTDLQSGERVLKDLAATAHMCDQVTSKRVIWNRPTFPNVHDAQTVATFKTFNVPQRQAFGKKVDRNIQNIQE